MRRVHFTVVSSSIKASQRLWGVSGRFAYSGGSSSLRSRAVRFVKSNWFTISMPVVVMCAGAFPDVMRNGGYARFELWKDYSIAGIFFASGLGIPVSQLGAVLRMWRVHAFIQSSTFMLAPLLFWATSPLLSAVGLPTSIVLGWLILGCLPISIGVSSALTRVAGGDAATTLLNSAASNIMGVFVTPILCLWVTGMKPSIEAGDVIKKLMLIVAAPAVAGIALRFLLPSLGRHDHIWGLLQSAFLIPVLFNVFSNAFVSGKDDDGPRLGLQLVAQVFAAAALMNLGLTGLNYWLAGFLPIAAPLRAAAAFCGSQKTASMGVPIMATMFHDDPQLALLTLPLLCYHPVQAGFGGIYAPMVRKRLALTL